MDELRALVEEGGIVFVTLDDEVLRNRAGDEPWPRLAGMPPIR